MEKAVDNKKKAIDAASYKLYYVNYEIRVQPAFHSSSLTKGLTNRAALPHLLSSPNGQGF
jgi:hypothetical protein